LCLKATLTAQVDTLRFVREPAVDTKRRVHESRDAVLGDGLELLDVLCVEGDKLAVLVDAGGGYGFGEDGGVACDCEFN
jgi:guanyl-specific ribonuclease Sa